MPEMIVSGVKEFSAALTGLEERMNRAAYGVVTKGGAIVAKNAQKQFTRLAIDGSGTARVLSSGEKKNKGEILGTKYQGKHVSGDQPHIRTGTLARSIAVHETRQMGPGRWMSKTGPTAAYGRRVELGFRGKDALGRNYNQQPYPYMAPGFRESREELTAMYEAEWRRALNG